MRKAFLISTGSELLNFKFNRYPPLFSHNLKSIGYDLVGEITTKDDKNSIKNALDFASRYAQLIIVCGGLGPTFDDLTREAVSEYLKTPLIFSQKVKKLLEKRYPRLNKQNLENQSSLLQGAILFENRFGTAFGEMIRKNKKTYLLLPGPKNEWESMWGEIKKHLKYNGRIYSITFNLADIVETEVEHIIKDLIEKHKGISYTILAGAQICHLNILSDDKKEFKKVTKEINSLLSEYIYGYDDDTLSGIVGKILTEKSLTISTAESCTGGLLSSTITDTPGSSRYFIGGINAYSNEVKKKLLGVKETTLKRYGAVSYQTAMEMVRGVKRVFNTSTAVSITGIAGPGGGSKKKPVGTVFIATMHHNEIKITKRIFSNRERRFIKEAAVNTALWNLYKMIK